MPDIDAENKAIGDRIRGRREYLGLSQADVAAALGRTRGWATSVERGENAILAPDLARVADILRCPPGYLLGDVVPTAALEEMELLALWRNVPAEARPFILAQLRGIVKDNGGEETNG